LDGGSLEVTFDSSRSNRAYVMINVGSLVAGRTYLLRFSAEGTRNEKSMSVFLRKAGSPYTVVTEAPFCKVNNYRTENEILLIPTTSESAATLVFDISEQNRLWLDNISLAEADVTLTNPDSIFFTVSNTLAEAKTYSLNEAYVDAKGATFNNSITVPPFTSVVLMKKSLSEQKKPSIGLQGLRRNDGISLNWQTTFNT
jgi:hypothetical protein